MSVRRVATAATFVIGSAVPLVAVTATAAVAAPGIHGSLCNPPADTVGPVVTQVTFGQPTIDLDGSRAQTVTVTAADTSGNGAPSGVARVSLFVRGNRYGATPKLALTSGTPASGQWTGQFVVSKYAHPGTYSLGEIDVIDAAGNEQNYLGYGKTPEGPNALSLHPADDPTFTVTGTPAKRPVKHPGAVKSFTFSPDSVNTKTAPKHARVTAHFTGAQPEHVSVRFENDKDAGKVRPVFLSAGLHRHGREWSGSLRVPQWLGTRVLQANLFAQYGPDYRPRYRNYDAAHLHKLNLPSKLAVVSGVDRKAPTLTSLSLSPDPIDSTAGAQLVTVTAQAADAKSGVRFIEVDANIHHGVNGLAGGTYPHAAAGIGFLSSDYLHVRLKQTANGDWVGTTKVKRCVPSGTYKLTAYVGDKANNQRGYSTKDLAKAGLTSTVDVTSKRGDVVAPYVFSAATVVANNQLVLNFSEGVANVDTSTLSVYPLSPQSSRFTTPADVTGITCYHGKSEVACSGSGGLVTTAVLSLDLDSGKKYQVYANLNQVTTQLTDGNGNPMDWNYDATEVLGA